MTLNESLDELAQYPEYISNETEPVVEIINSQKKIVYSDVDRMINEAIESSKSSLITNCLEQSYFIYFSLMNFNPNSRE